MRFLSVLSVLARAEAPRKDKNKIKQRSFLWIHLGDVKLHNKSRVVIGYDIVL